MTQFVERFGAFRQSPHVEFCSKLNQNLIDHYQPKAIISPGLSKEVIKCAVVNYGLKKIADVPSDTGHCLIEHYSDGRRPWIFTKHWTGSFGFPAEQSNQIKNYVRKVVRLEDSDFCE